jgi:hypothetical protein
MAMLRILGVGGPGKDGLSSRDLLAEHSNNSKSELRLNVTLLTACILKGCTVRSVSVPTNKTEVEVTAKRLREFHVEVGHGGGMVENVGRRR